MVHSEQLEKYSIQCKEQRVSCTTIEMKEMNQITYEMKRCKEICKTGPARRLSQWYSTKCRKAYN